MISLRLAVPAILAAAAAAGCFTYFVTQPAQVAADQRSPPPVSNVTGPPDSGTPTNISHPSPEDHITAFERAAEAILKRAQSAGASAGTEPPITGRIPLPKRRPITRP